MAKILYDDGEPYCSECNSVQLHAMVCYGCDVESNIPCPCENDLFLKVCTYCGKEFEVD